MLLFFRDLLKSCTCCTIMSFEQINEDVRKPQFITSVFILFFCSYCQFHQTDVLIGAKCKCAGHRVWCILFYQQNCAQLYQNTQLEDMYNFSDLFSMLCTRKTSVNLLTQKWLVKWWWNWPLDDGDEYKNVCFSFILQGFVS